MEDDYIELTFIEWGNEYEWGVAVEQHGYCDRCGFMIEQVYSPSFECFSDRKKGFKDYKGIYHAKNVKKHKRIRRKCNYDKKIEINPTWSMYVWLILKTKKSYKC